MEETAKSEAQSRIELAVPSLLLPPEAGWQGGSSIGAEVARLKSYVNPATHELLPCQPACPEVSL